MQTRIELHDQIHKATPFYKRKMLDGTLDKVFDEINEHVEPLKDEQINLDRLCLLFLIIGSIGTFITGCLLAVVVSIYAMVGLIFLYMIVLGGVYIRNYWKQQVLQQCIVLNLAILIYLANTNVLFMRGVKAQLGYAGQWIEFNNKKTKKMSKTLPNRPLSHAIFKRELPGLQQAGLYLETQPS